MSSETTVQEKLHAVTIKLDAETENRARAVYHAIRVEKEPNASVKKTCTIDGQFVNVKLESKQFNSLRASSNGILDIFTILSNVVQKFELESPSQDYDHF